VSRSSIHPSAVVHPKAELGEGVLVEPFAVVEEGVTIGARSVIGQGCRVYAGTVVGEGNRFFPHCTVGAEPQDLKFKGEKTALVIGNGNVFREFCAIHRGTAEGGGVTRIGDGNLLMAYTHIAHDCRVGGQCVFANAATLSGHVTVEDGATVGALTGVHQFCRVGKHAFIGGMSGIPQDALPFVKTVGNRARTFGINTIGLERKGFSAASIEALKEAYRLLFRARLNTAQALEAIRRDVPPCPEVDYLVTFIETSERGFIGE
jgi:UDP-N-acetylglucosamine acyltransferase